MKKDMLSQTFKDKKAISVMIGYVLLIAFAVIIGVVTYAWIQTYAPTESLECQDGVSLFIKTASFNPTTNSLTVTLKNTGRFSIAGYFIQMSDTTDKVVNKDIADGILSGGDVFGNSIVYIVGSNSFAPGNEKQSIFSIPKSFGEPYSVKVTPVRYQEFNEQRKFVSCGDSSTVQLVGEGVPGETETTQCNDGVDNDENGCGDLTDTGCSDSNDNTESGGTCIECVQDSECSGNNICVDNSCTATQCSDLNDNDGNLCSDLDDTGCTDLSDNDESGGTCVVCGDGNIEGTEECDDAGNNGVACTPSYGSSCDYCSTSCETITIEGSYCGDGIVDSGDGEECDTGVLGEDDGCLDTCQVDSGWVCETDTQANPQSICSGGGDLTTCKAYCQYLGYDYDSSSCVNGNNACTNTVPGDNTDEAPISDGGYGDQLCVEQHSDPNQDNCCCAPPAP